jgi:hypothetical protein
MFASQSNRLPEYADSEAYQVYAAVLPAEWPVRIAKAKMLIIQAETSSYQMCLRPEKEWEEIVGPAIAQYLTSNSHPWRLQQMFSLDVLYTVVGIDEIRAVLDRSGWSGFGRQYPDSGGFIELSAVGFNPDKTVAVVYVGHHCGDLCGGGTFHVLQKRDGKWLPLDWRGASCAWAS